MIFSAVLLVFAVLCLIAGIGVKIYYNPLLWHELQAKKEKAVFSLNRLWLADEQSPLTPNTAATLAVVMFFLSILLGTAMGDILMGVLLGVSLFLFGPRILVNFLKDRKVKRFKHSFEFGLEVLLSALEIGMPLEKALKEAARTSPEPVKSELARTAAEISMGTSEDIAFKNLAVRVPCEETDELRDAIMLYKDIGGTRGLDLLKAVLMNLRESMNMAFQVKQHTKGVRVSAVIVAIIPFIYFTLMMSMAPELFSPLFFTPAGRQVLFVSILILIFGGVLIYQILRDVEQL